MGYIHWIFQNTTAFHFECDFCEEAQNLVVNKKLPSKETLGYLPDNWLDIEISSHRKILCPSCSLKIKERLTESTHEDVHEET